MDANEKLTAINELMQLKARYFYYLDHKMWDDWVAQYTEDGTLRYDMSPTAGGLDPNTIGPIVGRAALREHLAEHVGPMRTVHHGHTPIFTFQSDTEATGIWAMQDIVENNEVRALGHGHYHETYRKEADGQWRFASTHLTRLRVEVNSLGNWPVH